MYSLESLIKDLQKNTYTPRTDAERQEAATARYQSVYDQKRLAAEQATQKGDLAMQQQAAALDQAYSKQMEQSALNYRQAGSDADRSLLKRGMQRSSYGASALGNIAVAGIKAQDEILGTKNQQLGNVEEQRALLASQLAEQLQQYSSSEQLDILAYMDELERQDYDREFQSQQYNNSLAAQIYQLTQEEKRYQEDVKRYKAATSGGKSPAKTSGSSTPSWKKLGYPSLAAYNEAKSKGWNYSQWKANQNGSTAATGDDALLAGIEAALGGLTKSSGGMSKVTFSPTDPTLSKKIGSYAQ